MICPSMCYSLESEEKPPFLLIWSVCRDWWFASTAIPLLAATIGPFANVLSIAALVSKWRVNLPNNGQLPEGTDNAGVDIPDPRW
jgi:hypothetical protein